MEYGLQAWLLMSASLVLLMTTPALALFYGGMSRSKSVLNMLMMSFSAVGVIGIVYVLWGWSMSYGSTDVAMLFANPFEMFGLDGVEGGTYLAVGFQLTFAVITAALISGAVADRLKFSAWLVFLPLWVTLSYFPLAHMVWGGGFLSGEPGALADLITDEVAPIDYAGGTVVHINAGVAGLVLAVLLGRRLGFGKEPMKPHNLTLTMIGAGLLWFGWFGFNVGSWVPGDLTGDEAGAYWIAESSLVWLNTTVAACAAMLGWLVVEKVRDRHATSLGAASGIVAGLVAITPAAGALSPVGAIVLGLVA
ncbi:MAG: ammonium transporter, partial [Nocardioides sp.]|nr:ammonium transporter [Nocardioides sp.]